VTRLAVLLAMLVAGPALADGLRSAFGPGDLTAAHHTPDGEPLPCEACHLPGDFVRADRCGTCHTQVFGLSQRSLGFHANRKEACASCHQEHRGEDARLIEFDPAAFDHDEADFPLDDGHRGVACARCHAPETWLGAGPGCAYCHEQPHGDRLLQPTRLADCATCHQPTTFADATMASSFDHNDPTAARFSLSGAHASADCGTCHQAAVFAPLPATCDGCHDSPHRAADGACDDCHDTGDWSAESVDHARLGFPLIGSHRTTACKSCHAADRLAPLPHDRCDRCHDDAHDGEFAPRDCGSCHDPRPPAFRAVQVDHSLWPLDGKHSSAACADCHGSGPQERWSGIDRTCGSCHDDVHGERFAPDPCSACHGVDGWKPAPTFDRADHGRTGFELTGRHADPACSVCHGDSAVPAPSSGCEGCHEDPHSGQVPGCPECHEPGGSWRSVAFEHPVEFALDDGHDGVTCRRCHSMADFAAASSECRACHDGDAPPRHFPGPCSQCHSAAAWTGAELDAGAHAAVGFPLRFAHARLGCEACHATARSGLSRCIDCHESEDPHRNLLGDDCAACHRENSWSRSTFNHRQTGWPLRSEHALAECNDCHSGGFVGTPRDCQQCHGEGTAWP